MSLNAKAPLLIETQAFVDEVAGSAFDPKATGNPPRRRAAGQILETRAIKGGECCPSSLSQLLQQRSHVC